jgi:hypothetical protein
MAAVCGTDLVSGAGEMARRFAQVKVAQLDDLEDRAYADPHVVRAGLSRGPACADSSAGPKPPVHR